MSQPHALISADLSFLDRQRPLGLVATLAVRFAVTASKWAIRVRTRRTLKTLDPHLLRDIGLTKDAADIEANKRFWHV